MDALAQKKITEAGQHIADAEKRLELIMCYFSMKIKSH